jgi:TPR repeat protein
MGAEEADNARLIAAFELLKTDPEKALSELKELAELGLTTAAINLGWAYHHGKGTPLDLDRAEFWLKYAFDSGDNAASYYLGNLYTSQGKIDKANMIYKHGVEHGFFHRHIVWQ